MTVLYPNLCYNNAVATTLKKLSHQRETTGSSSDSLQLRPFQNGNFS